MREILTIPNIITIFRMFLVLPIILSLINNRFVYAIALFAIASLSDILDGFLARKYNKVTKTGAILDPLADKLLLNYTFVILTTKGLIPQLLLIVILFKDIILISGSTVEVLSAKDIRNVKIKASTSGKIATFSQVIVIFLVFLSLFEIRYPAIIFSISVYISILLSLFSLASYINQYKTRNIHKGGK